MCNAQIKDLPFLTAYMYQYLHDLIFFCSSGFYNPVFLLSCDSCFFFSIFKFVSCITFLRYQVRVHLQILFCHSCLLCFLLIYAPELFDILCSYWQGLLLGMSSWAEETLVFIDLEVKVKVKSKGKVSYSFLCNYLFRFCLYWKGLLHRVVSTPK